MLRALCFVWKELARITTSSCLPRLSRCALYSLAFLLRKSVALVSYKLALGNMSPEVGSPKLEPAPAAPLSSIPLKRALDEGHSPAVPSPLNPEVIRSTDSQPPEDAAQPSRAKPSRAKKETLKKREARGIDSARATPDPKSSREPKQSESGPLRYKLAPPKLSDFEPPRGPVLTLHHEVALPDGNVIEFLEASDQ